MPQSDLHSVQHSHPVPAVLGMGGPIGAERVRTRVPSRGDAAVEKGGGQGFHAGLLQGRMGQHPNAECDWQSGTAVATGTGQAAVGWTRIWDAP